MSIHRIPKNSWDAQNSVYIFCWKGDGLKKLIQLDHFFDICNFIILNKLFNEKLFVSCIHDLESSDNIYYSCNNENNQEIELECIIKSRRNVFPKFLTRFINYLTYKFDIRNAEFSDNLPLIFMTCFMLLLWWI